MKSLALLFVVLFSACVVGDYGDEDDPTFPNPFGPITRIRGEVSTGSGFRHKRIVGAEVSASRIDTAITTTDSTGFYNLYMGLLGSLAPPNCDSIMIRVAADGYETVQGRLSEFDDCQPAAPFIWVSFTLEPVDPTGEVGLANMAEDSE